jgi:hypothetical protein
MKALLVQPRKRLATAGIRFGRDLSLRFISMAVVANRTVHTVHTVLVPPAQGPPFSPLTLSGPQSVMGTMLLAVLILARFQLVDAIIALVMV